MHVVLRMVFHPRMIWTRVVRDEIEHEAQATRPKALAETGKRHIAAEVRVQRVAGDRKSAPGNILVTQIRERVHELPPPLRVGAGDVPRGETGLPHAQQPHPVEAFGGDPIEVSIGNVVEG